MLKTWCCKTAQSLRVFMSLWPTTAPWATSRNETSRPIWNSLSLPDLMIYLRSSVEHLVSNIQKRGRDYEQTMQIEYLDNLNRRYEDFINNHYKGRVMIVEKDNLDFENRPEDFVGITNRIDSLLYGLFPINR